MLKYSQRKINLHVCVYMYVGVLGTAVRAAINVAAVCWENVRNYEKLTKFRKVGKKLCH